MDNMDNSILPTIETERLILRQVTADDAEAYFEWAGDERVTKYMSYSTYSSAEQVRDWLETVPKVWVYVRKSDGLLIGSGVTVRETVSGYLVTICVLTVGTRAMRRKPKPSKL